MNIAYKLIYSILATTCICSFMISGHAQTSVSKFSPYESFAPFFYLGHGDNTRTADGRPAAGYWQNRADYSISTRFDTTGHLTSDVVITYTNNSPQALDYLWLQLDQNIYSDSSRGRFIYSEGRFSGVSNAKGGYEIKSVRIIQHKKSYQADFNISDTRMRVWLRHPLQAKGGELKLRIVYSFFLAQHGTDRNGILATKNGTIYQVAQWFPRMCVYDNIQGWNTLPYLGQGEFYLEYGNIDYAITLPEGYIVVGSGELTNAEEVLNKAELARLAQARLSDSTIFIRSLEEMFRDVRSISGKLVTWHFRCNNTRDVAWATSKAFIWDAARIKLQGGKAALAMSVYPEECSSLNYWGNSTQFVKGAVEYYSGYLMNYTYPVATNVAGVVYGMEYPGIVFSTAEAQGRTLWEIVSHEFGHNWFPMIVGSNERKFPWMDEGFNTFINDLADAAYNHGQFFSKEKLSVIGPRYNNEDAETIMTLADAQKRMPSRSYSKPSYGLHMLREVILDPQRFDKAFSYYVHEWSFKHPTPFDFFHCIENVSGEKLDWFWRGWFFNNWKIDLAIDSVRSDSSNTGSIVEVGCLEQMPMPFTLELTDDKGSVVRLKVPVEIWERGAEWRYHLDSKIVKAVIDPDGGIPDIHPENNSWIRSRPVIP